MCGRIVICLVKATISVSTYSDDVSIMLMSVLYIFTLKYPEDGDRPHHP